MCSCAASCGVINDNNNNNNKSRRSADAPQSSPRPGHQRNSFKSSKPRGPGFPSLEFSCIKDTVERRCLSLPSVYSLALLCHRRRRQMCCRINGADVAVISTEGRRRCMALKVARRPAVQVGGGGGRESGSIATSARSRRRLTVAG